LYFVAQVSQSFPGLAFYGQELLLIQAVGFPGCTARLGPSRASPCGMMNHSLLLTNLRSIWGGTGDAFRPFSDLFFFFVGRRLYTTHLPPCREDPGNDLYLSFFSLILNLPPPWVCFFLAVRGFPRFDRSRVEPDDIGVFF